MPGRGSLKAAIVMTCAKRKTSSSSLLEVRMLRCGSYTLRPTHAASLTSLQQDANGQNDARIHQPALRVLQVHLRSNAVTAHCSVGNWLIVRMHLRKVGLTRPASGTNEPAGSVGPPPSRLHLVPWGSPRCWRHALAL